MGAKRISTQLILLLTALLCLGLIMAIFTHRTIVALQYDAGMINQAGTLRGAMQRLVKLEILQPGTTELQVESIDELMARFVRQRADLSRRAAEEGSEQRLREAEESWQALKAALLEYRKNPTSGNRRILLDRSEDSWRKADAVVLAAQQLTEYKVAGIRLLYLGIALNVITALVVLLVVYVYVRKRIEYQATHDTLTRLLNRHSFEQELSMEINRSRRYNHPFSLILLDIDHFKRINDRFGHKAGDQVLAATGGLVKGLMRKSDQVFRIGGEEFAIVASETAGENGVRLAEKVRQEVEKYDFGTGERVTVSLGVAQWGRETDADLFRNADRALYRAKEGGRNQTRLFSWVDHAAPG